MAEPRSDANDAKTPRWVYAFAIIGMVLVVVFAVAHLTGRGMGHHGMPFGGQKPHANLPEPGPQQP